MKKSNPPDGNCCRRSRVFGRAVVVAGLAIAWTLSTAPTVDACRTPVFRYAMYNWEPAPYYVFYLHQAEPDESDAKIAKVITELSDKEGPYANVAYEAIDVTDEEKMKLLPKQVQDEWKSEAGGQTPTHLVYAPPRGYPPRPVLLHAGRLDDPTVRAMVESPARKRLGELLDEGHATVLVFLPGSDKAENERVEKALQETIKEVEGGAIPFDPGFDPDYMMYEEEESEEAGSEEGDAEESGEEAVEDGEEDEDPADANRLRVAMLKVDRSDKAESWFVRTLMAVEDDLAEYVDDPMVFAAYGQGRVIEPYIGEGISTDNLLDVVAFLSSACSCTVKAQNPGVDLLVRWDWAATANKMAANDPTMDVPYYYDEYPVASEEEAEEPVKEPAESQVSDEALTDAAVATEEADQEDQDPPVASEDGGPQDPQAVAPAETATEEPEADGPTEAVATAATAATGQSSESGSFMSGQILILGVGFAVVVVCLIAVSLVVLLRRG